MAKGWKRISTVNDNINAETAAQKQHREQAFANAIHNMKTFTLEDLKKHSDDLCAEKEAKDTKILEAFNEKKLKSKGLIKYALQIKKEREKAKKKKAQKKES